MSDWTESRKADEGPDFERIDATALDKALSTLKAEGYDLAIIDTAGIDSPATNAAMRAADLCLIPCRPTATDLRGCLPTVQSLIRLEKDFAFVLTQCPPRSPRVDETRTGLAALGMIAEPPIVSRADHQDAMAARPLFWRGPGRHLRMSRPDAPSPKPRMIQMKAAPRRQDLGNTCNERQG